MFSVQWIRQQALAVGFDDCGVALAERLDEDAAFMDRWVAQGLHGNMSYLERNREKRYDPRELVPGATAVVVCVLRYDKCRRDYHRTIKSLWGYSENAVKTHLWVAICDYLLLAKIKADTKSPYTITEVATLIRVSALERTDLRELLTQSKDSNSSNQNVKEPTLFNDL